MPAVQLGGVPADELAPGLGVARLSLRPVDQFFEDGHPFRDQALDDLFLTLEVVVQRGLGDSQPFGDLTQ